MHRALRDYQIPTRSIPEAKQKIAVGKEELAKLYLDKKFSTDHIGKLLGCDRVTILNYLKRYEIPRRSKLGTRKPVRIKKEILIDFYQNKKLTQKQIAQIFGHSRFGIQRWMKIYGIKSRSDSESHTKYPKNDFSEDLLEKAYRIGFRLGDLNVYKVHELVQVRCSTTKKAQVELIENLFKKYGHVHVWIAKRGTFEIVVLLNQSFDFLLTKEDKVEEWKGLGKLGIETRFSMSRPGGSVDRRGISTNKDVWRLTVSKKQSLWNFIKIIEPYHSHKDKLRTLKMVKNNLLLRNQLLTADPLLFNSPFPHQVAFEVSLWVPVCRK